MTDEIAIVTKAKENIMFVMSALSVDQRRQLSYTKEEFVQKCSFNGKACDIDKYVMTEICFAKKRNKAIIDGR